MFDSGYHTHVYPTGSKYEGYWKNGQRNGQGKHTYTEGGCYEGEFLDDRRHGHGKYTYPDGSVFEGDFLYGRREGKGRYRYAQGSEYTGDWLADKMHGQGSYMYANGNSYSGQWEEDMPHGRGQLKDGAQLFDVVHDRGALLEKIPASDAFSGSGAAPPAAAMNPAQPPASGQAAQRGAEPPGEQDIYRIRYLGKALDEQGAPPKAYGAVGGAPAAPWEADRRRGMDPGQRVAPGAPEEQPRAMNVNPLTAEFWDAFLCAPLCARSKDGKPGQGSAWNGLKVVDANGGAR